MIFFRTTAQHTYPNRREKTIFPFIISISPSEDEHFRLQTVKMRRKVSSILNFLYILWFAVISTSSQNLMENENSTMENYPETIEFAEFDGLILYCESITFKWDSRDLETCNIRNLTVFNQSSTVIEVLHDDSNPTLVITFRGLLIENQAIKSIPLELGAFFVDLKFLRIWNSELEFVNKNDFEYLADLEGIDLVENKLTFLPSDLFEHNLRLRHLDFSHNPLQFVGEHFLDRLIEATTIDFSSCNCIHYKYNFMNCGDMRPLRSKLIACSERRLKFNDTNEIVIKNNLTNWSGGGASTTSCSLKFQQFFITSFSIMITMTFIWR